MNGWLLDTNIVSLLAPKKDGGPKLSSDLAAWMRKHTDSLFLPAISITEIRAGIRKLRRSGGEARSADLELWLGNLVSNYGDRILPVEVKTAIVAGDIADYATAAGRNPGLADILVAATAQRHGLCLLTANTKHFEHLSLNIQVRNPLDQ
ncbi:type II toxin-antitoxin system VapC family toxin [Fulvimarina sp. 2208YS6-2-32]|uniref:Type II toxin-antitoxin system VapC family toxin n=1 Tax=Fulvimarina uroteuthidis TaxID=3098149 RepID=A0ABU5I266_9HYPH|nr:type II toxin-antitoxin system VapC family toxin [Fulvimarina sp. 2208YS6-2-32]MDY8108863.1 type II toxin-antitoxin system VapC family toxin [Fulvimarina sp. 2208YS6-2-32]